MHTSFYLALFLLVYFRLSVKVIQARRKFRVSYGMGPNQEIAGIVSAHSNFAAYVPMALLSLFLLEIVYRPPFWLIHLLGALFLTGRLIHAYGLSEMEALGKSYFNYRVRGMKITLWWFIGVAVLLLGFCGWSVYSSLSQGKV